MSTVSTGLHPISSVAARGGRRVLLIGLVTALGACTDTDQADRTPGAGPLVDHHVHIAGPLVQKQVDLIRERSPETFALLSEDIFSKPSVADALRLLDEAGVEQAVVVSSAYLLLSPGGPKRSEMERLMREENAFTVDAARASEGRLVAFIAVDPLAPNAHDELRYWAGEPSVSGVKLHLGAAGFDAGSPEQVEKLAAFFTEARERDLPLVLHMRGGGAYDVSEVETFIEQVLSRAGDLPVQIAHGGGYAGADPTTIAALGAFGDAIARGAPGTRNLLFDLSGVVVPDDIARALGTDEAQLQAFVARMREIGLDRFVLGSDWPAIGNPKAYYERVRAELPVTAAEWERLRRNRAPYLPGSD